MIPEQELIDAINKVFDRRAAASQVIDEIDEEQVCQCAGAAMPSVIEPLLKSLLNDNFDMAYKNVMNATTELGYALVDITTSLSERVLQLDFPPMIHAHLLDNRSSVAMESPPTAAASTDPRVVSGRSVRRPVRRNVASAAP